MAIATIHRSRSTWVIFLTTVFLSAISALVNLSEFVNVGLLQRIEDYPFGTEGPVAWYYKTAQCYATVSLIFGTLSLAALVCSVLTFRKVNRRVLGITFLTAIVLILIQILDGQT